MKSHFSDLNSSLMSIFKQANIIHEFADLNSFFVSTFKQVNLIGERKISEINVLNFEGWSNLLPIRGFLTRIKFVRYLHCNSREIII
ncbi:hypothetical protein SUGI_1105540 [Cryptomeria japonica]|nr:hypothetical protein SUGI_1105540 [Cryptomeria japonica]